MRKTKKANLKHKWQGQELDRFIWEIGIKDIMYKSITLPKGTKCIGIILLEDTFIAHWKLDPKPFTCYQLHQHLTTVLKKENLPTLSNLCYHLRRYEQEGYLKSEININDKNRKERKYSLTKLYKFWDQIIPFYIKFDHVQAKKEYLNL